MYKAYVDESGKPSFNNFGNYTLAALIVEGAHEKAVNIQVRNLFEKICTKYKLLKTETIFTATNILRRGSTFYTLHIDDRLEIMRSIVNLVLELKCQFVTIVFDKTLVWDKNRNFKYTTDWVYDWTWKLMIEKLTKFFDLNSKLEENSGIIILNSLNPQYNTSKINQINNIISSEGGFIEDDLIEEIQFSIKSENYIQQLTDIIAWVVNRFYYRKTDNLFDDLAFELFEIIS